MITTDWIQAIAMVVLVGITIFYAWQVRRTVSEMRLQRLATKPVVVPDIDAYFEQKSYIDNMRDIAQSGFPVVLANVGTATAIELELLLKTPINKFISAKLPLLLPGASWRSKLTYVADFTKEGEPIYGLPPLEGLYELKVTFRSATSYPDVQFSEVILPFDLHWAGEGFWWNISRHELCQKILE